MTNISSLTFAAILAALAGAQDEQIVSQTAVAMTIAMPVEPGMADLTIAPPLPTILTHQCDIPAKNCDWGEQYWNGLACECHASYHCEKLCPEGESMYPLEVCQCASDERIRTHYPKWATDEEIDMARQNGLVFAQSRPQDDDWRQCPREELKPGTCERGWYWNELACECFPTFMCMIWCGEGYVNDPRSGCGCLTAQEARNIYPEWATPLDIYDSNQEGQEYVVGSARWRVCPYYDHVADCPIRQYWNELSCQCFFMAQCRIGCQEGTELSPLSSCKCTDSEELQAKLYPEWASEADISAANEAGWNNYKNPDGIWPTCEKVDCEDDFYFNKLACQCFSASECETTECEVIELPTAHCACAEDKAEFYDLFPHWATEEMIDESIDSGLSQWESILRRPSDWPECPQIDDIECNLFNELACSCWSEIMCALWCGEDKVLDPRKGCSCITLEEERQIYPEWATDKDIDIANRLMWNDYMIQPVPMPVPMPPAPRPTMVKPSNWPDCELREVCEREVDQFNELACRCFSMLQCQEFCASGTRQDPVSGCGCIPEEEVLALYPAWATEKDIDYSWKLAWDQHSNQWDIQIEPWEPIPMPMPAPVPMPEPQYEIPVDWPACNTFVPCTDPQVLNVLACNCFSIIQCDIWCGEDSTTDPVDGCTCISNEKARGYYPDWASDKDIDYSQKIMWQTYENQMNRMAAQTVVVNFNGGSGGSGGSGANTNDSASGDSAEMMEANKTPQQSNSEKDGDQSIADNLDMFGNDGAHHFTTAAFWTSTALVTLTVNVF